MSSDPLSGDKTETGSAASSEAPVSSVVQPTAATTVAGPEQAALAVVQAQAIGRPTLVTQLLFDEYVSTNWFVANKRMNRFYLLNLGPVLTALNLDHTLAKPFFIEAAAVIRDETDWYDQYPFSYESSHTQIYPDKRHKPKDFGHAAAIIVAMERAAAALRPGYDVYASLRILSAEFFVDMFDEKRLLELKKHFADLTVEERIATFGAGADKKTFDQIFLEAIDQPAIRNVHGQLANGYCGTMYVCDKVHAFVNGKFPAELHVGPVLPSGAENAVISELGRKNAAPDLRVPRTRTL